MTFVGVEVDAGRARLELAGGNLAPRVISVDATGAKVALVATTALLLGGDRVELNLRVGPGAWLEIIETAGTVVYDSEGRLSNWTVMASVAAGGLLLWPGEPFVVATGANVARRGEFDLAGSAVLCVRETVVLGRVGETGGAVRSSNRMRRGGAPVLIEDLDLREVRQRRLPGVIGAARVIDTITMLGASAPDRPALPDGARFELDGSVGTVGRVLRSGLAGSPVAHCWTRWGAAARAAYSTRPAIPSVATGPAAR